MIEKTDISVRYKFLQYFTSFIESRVTPEGVLSIRVTHDDKGIINYFWDCLLSANLCPQWPRRDSLDEY